MQPDDLAFFDEWGAPPNNPDAGDRTPITFPSAGLPNIERLREGGLQMMQAYTASPMCGTSRFSTITSKYPSRSAIARAKAEDNNIDRASVVIPNTKLQDVDGMNDCSEDNIAATLKRNGYQTAMIGKWHLSSIADESYTYDSAVQTVQGCGFTHVAGLYIENLTREEAFFNNYRDGTFSHNMEWITYEAIEFIKSSEEPFFLYFNPTVPHRSNSVTAAIRDFSCQDTAAGNLGFDPIIEGMTEGYDGCVEYRESIFERGNSEGDYGAIWLDDSVGALLTALEEKGALENTIFLFQGDHGMDTKGSLYEGGIRIPQFIHYPAKIEVGTKFDAPVSTIDVGVTMLDFAGIKHEYTVDGISWMDAIGNADLESYFKNDRCLFFEQEKDRAARCDCDKYLNIFEATPRASTTYKRGNRYGYSVDLFNLFDMCGGGADYVSEMSTSMEEASLNLASLAPGKATLLSEVLQCHNDRTHWKNEPDFPLCKITTSNESPTPSPASHSTPSTPSTPSTSNGFKVSNTSNLFQKSFFTLILVAIINN